MYDHLLRGTILAASLLLVTSVASAQTWASTATQAFPTQYLPTAVLLGPLAPSTSMHVVLGLQAQNASQMQSTLQALNGGSLTLQQFVAQFGATSAQVTAVKNYLTSMGFKDITVAGNQLMIDAYAPAGKVEAAFHTSLAEYTLNGATVYLNTSAAQVPA
jgi:subtilase family serine protease